MFLDFKRSSDNGSGTRLSDIDRNNLAKAVSGFGNSEGGVVIWGVDCSRDQSGADVARAKVPIVDVQRFVSWLEGAVSGCTVPPHSHVVHCAIPDETGTSGFVATHIPRSFAVPHQMVGRLQYFIRAGSDFVPTPHMVLAGMFGRAIPPNVIHQYAVARAKLNSNSISCQVGLLLHNLGPGIASDLYTTLKCWDFPDHPSSLEFEIPDNANWTGNFAFGRFCNLISKADFRLPPEAHTNPLVLTLTIAAPIADGIRVSGAVGAGNSPPHRIALGSTQAQLVALYDEIIALRDSGESLEFEEKLRSFPSSAFGVGETVAEGGD